MAQKAPSLAQAGEGAFHSGELTLPAERASFRGRMVPPP